MDGIALLLAIVAKAMTRQCASGNDRKKTSLRAKRGNLEQCADKFLFGMLNIRAHIWAHPRILT